ncbi:hypothetical protein L0B80_25070, partial [Ralstonia solanacearum]|nr:hypothetical protein [Ralstonia solanacearum]
GGRLLKEIEVRLLAATLLGLICQHFASICYLRPKLSQIAGVRVPSLAPPTPGIVSGQPPKGGRLTP